MMMAVSSSRGSCQVIGISARTIQQWQRHPEADDRRCGPRHRPGNALSVREETEVLAVLLYCGERHAPMWIARLILILMALLMLIRIQVLRGVPPKQ